MYTSVPKFVVVDSTVLKLQQNSKSLNMQPWKWRSRTSTIWLKFDGRMALLAISFSVCEIFTVKIVNKDVWTLTLWLSLSGDPAIQFWNMAPLSGGPARMLPAKWRHYLGARLERYLQNGAVIRMPGFTHRPSV